jgi:diphthine-ammonia ligase
MRLGALFSGGKDSTLALHIAAEKEDIVCLITVFSKNKESYMFHTPNIDITELQAKALQLPIVSIVTDGKKEEELADLEKIILQAKKKFQLDGIVTGAVESVYQSTRIKRICDKLQLSCINPLWRTDQNKLLETLLDKKFIVIISGIFAYPLDEKWLGKQIDRQIIAKLVELQKRFGISPSGEGGEIETTVLDAPMFTSRIEVIESDIEARGNSGVYIIKEARLTPKRAEGNLP